MNWGYCGLRKSTLTNQLFNSTCAHMPTLGFAKNGPATHDKTSVCHPLEKHWGHVGLCSCQLHQKRVPVRTMEAHRRR